MACNCKNPDGTLCMLCNGSCVNQNQYNHVDAPQLRTEKTIEDRMEYLLSCFLSKLDQRINSMEAHFDDQYLEAFKEGFELAREIYE